jgi:(p)ppGpp synthase/HD superfamily hydrolase
MSSQALSLWRLCVVADDDPGVIARVLERFQHLNVLPRRVTAECGSDATFHIQVDVFGLREDHMRLVVAKIRQNPSVVNAYWHRM